MSGLLFIFVEDGVEYFNNIASLNNLRVADGWRTISGDFYVDDSGTRTLPTSYAVTSHAHDVTVTLYNYIIVTALKVLFCIRSDAP